jgi:hypothetical protein
MIRAIVKTKEGWKSETEVPDPPPKVVEATVIEDFREKPAGPGPIPIQRECSGIFKLIEMRGKTPYYEQM